MSANRPIDLFVEIQREEGKLRRLLRGLVRGDEADDVVQETWLAACEHGERQGTNFRPWLSAAALNLAMKLRRSEGRRRQREQRVASKSELLQPSSRDLVARLEVRQKVVDAVLQLEAPLRDVVILKWFDDLAPADIASRLRIPRNTVYSRLRRAEDQLRRSLDHEFGSRSAWALPCLPLLPSGGAPPVSTAAGGTASVASSMNLPSWMLFGVLAMSKGKLVALCGSLALAPILFWIWSEVSSSTNERGPQSPSLETTTAISKAEGKSLERPDERRSSVKEELESESLPINPAPTSQDASVQVTVAWSDGTPAQGVGLRLHEWSGFSPHTHTRTARTDNEGKVLFASISPGAISVDTDRGGQDAEHTATLEKGEQLEIHMTMDKGTLVRGKVVDKNGTVVSGASIWVSNYGNHTDGFVVAQSDDRGRFEVREVGAFRWIGARKKDYSPSDVVMITSDGLDNVDLELVLPGEGGSLLGTVYDALGEPVEDALVQIVTDKDPRWYTLPNGQTGSTIGERLVRCRKDGTFSLDGLDPGLSTLKVSSPRFSLWSEEIEIHASKPTTRDVFLNVGFSVFGSVRDAQDSPVADVIVHCGDASEIGYVSTKTNRHGEYRLARLSSGEALIAAEHESMGHVEKTITGAVGSTLEWNIVLDPMIGIQGVLLDREGSPLEGWTVHADAREYREGMDDAEDLHGRSRTDERGWFSIPNRHPVKHHLEAIAPDFSAYPLAVLENVVPSEQPLVLRVDVERCETTVHGQLRSEEGEGISTAYIKLYGETRSHGTSCKPNPDGTFELESILPGRYALRVSRTGSYVEEWIEDIVVGEETIDLGLLVLAPGGQLEADLTYPEECPPPRFWITRPDRSNRLTAQLQGDTIISEPLKAGLYTLWARGEGIAERGFPFEIHGRNTTRTAILLEAGVSRTLHIRLEKPRPDETLILRIDDEMGHPTATRTFFDPTRTTHVTNVVLVPGAYVATLTVSGQTLFEIEFLADETAMAIDLAE